MAGAGAEAEAEASVVGVVGVDTIDKPCSKHRMAEEETEGSRRAMSRWCGTPS